MSGDGPSPTRGRRAGVVWILVGALLIAGLVVAMTVGRQVPSETANQTPAKLSATDLDPIDAMQAFAQCMRDEGIANFPDPVGGGINLKGSGLDPNAPEFRAAHEACVSLLPQPPGRARVEGGPGPGEREGGGMRSGANSAWRKIVPGGDCACADGSEFAFWDRKADPAKVVLYLEGGGICFDATTCAFTGTGGENDFYDYNLSTEIPGFGSGIFEFDRADNPFGAYTFIYVPLCTGD
jgi:hypothetical protein